MAPRYVPPTEAEAVISDWPPQEFAQLLGISGADSEAVCRIFGPISESLDLHYQYQLQDGRVTLQVVQVTAGNKIAEPATQSQPTRRHKSPQLKKALDYIQQRRPKEGGERHRKVRKQLPRLERRKYRRTLNIITEAAKQDDEAAQTLPETLTANKRAHYTYLWPRRKTISLADAVGRERKESEG